MITIQNILIFIGVCYILAFLIIWFKKTDDGCEWWLFAPFTAIVGILFLFIGPLLGDVQESRGYAVYWQGDIISLENTSSQSGNISSSGNFTGWTMNGNISQSTNCSFVLDWKNGNITIQNADSSKIIFHEATDDRSVAQLHMNTFEYTKGFRKGKYFWDQTDFVWHIWIPKNNIKKYIKFN